MVTPEAFGEYQDTSRVICERMTVLGIGLVMEEINELQTGALQVGFCETKEEVLPWLRHPTADYVRRPHGRGTHLPEELLDVGR